MNNDVLIRLYQEEDRKQVQSICIATGFEQALHNKQLQHMLLTAFCNYYIDYEPNNCFVAFDGVKAAGYILCAEDSRIWADSFQNNYISKEQDSGSNNFYQGLLITPLKYAEEYPAHLHIDILPEYQRMGIGFKLMDMLISHLQAKEVPRLMLSVASDNIKGVRFYEKYGFTVLEKGENEIAMGICLKQ